jgi:hypothetical protein
LGIGKLKRKLLFKIFLLIISPKKYKKSNEEENKL